MMHIYWGKCGSDTSWQNSIADSTTVIGTAGWNCIEPKISNEFMLSWINAKHVETFESGKEWFGQLGTRYPRARWAIPLDHLLESCHWHCWLTCLDCDWLRMINRFWQVCTHECTRQVSPPPCFAKVNSIKDQLFDVLMRWDLFNAMWLLNLLE